MSTKVDLSLIIFAQNGIIMESKLKKGAFIVDEVLPALYVSNMVLVANKKDLESKEETKSLSKIIDNNTRVIGLIKKEFKEELDLDFLRRFGYENASK
ncbi:hypothetical protein DFQ07_1464 [Tenacibaculum caenipelagi]|uniref:Uncharacterized protein n=2 Tax=Tenacibaculum caenipelagi TaxID=1325435 RepID=A0A4R6TE19_9FLAO|nr:hypothetical protein DFQ07_1464 [Tenacibaculum caenipelagi]